MSKPGYTSFSVEVPINDEEKMNVFQEAMDAYSDSMIQYEKDLAKELGCSEYCAQDIHYLRSRSRWTQELENELIELDKLDKHPPVLAGWNGEPESEWEKI